jgi:hypothetical protein
MEVIQMVSRSDYSKSITSKQKLRQRQLQRNLGMRFPDSSTSSTGHRPVSLILVVLLHIVWAVVGWDLIQIEQVTGSSLNYTLGLSIIFGLLALGLYFHSDVARNLALVFALLSLLTVIWFTMFAFNMVETIPRVVESLAANFRETIATDSPHVLSLMLGIGFFIIFNLYTLYVLTRDRIKHCFGIY